MSFSRQIVRYRKRRHHGNEPKTVVLFARFRNVVTLLTFLAL